MEPLLTTTNTLCLSFVIAFSRDASIPVFVYDTNIFAVEAGVGVLSRPGYGAV